MIIVVIIILSLLFLKKKTGKMLVKGDYVTLVKSSYINGIMSESV